jgi:hypothetical protein
MIGTKLSDFEITAHLGSGECHAIHAISRQLSFSQPNAGASLLPISVARLR